MFSKILKQFSLDQFAKESQPKASQPLAESTKTSEQLRKGIVIFFQLLVVVVPFFFLTVNEELFEFNKMILTYLFASIILGCWALRAVIEKRLLFAKTPLDIPIGLFLLSQMISTFLSIHPRTSWFGYYTRFNGGLLSTFTYIMLFYAYVSNVQRKDQYRILWSLLIAAFGVTLYTIPEHFGHSPSCLIITGKFNATCWVQDVQNRIFGTFGQPNWLAAYAIMLFPIANFLVWKNKAQRNWKLFLPIIISTTLFLTLLFTKSRSGFLGWAVGSGVLVIGFLIIYLKDAILVILQTGRRTSRGASRLSWLLASVLLVSTQLLKRVKKDHDFRKSFYLLLAPCLLFPLIFALIFGTPFSQSIFDNNEPQTADLEPPTSVDRLEQGGTDSGEIRKIVWTGALRIWQRYPVFGSGVETFAYSYYQDRPVEHNNVSEWNFLYNKAHNEWLNFLANSGAVGLATYLFLQGMIVVLFLQILFSKQTTENKFLAIALLSGMVAVHVSNFFGFSTVVVSTLMWLFPAFALVQLKHLPSTKYQLPNTNLSRFQLLAGILVALMTLLFIVQILKLWLADYFYARAKSAYSEGQLQTALDKNQTALLLSPNEGMYHELNGKINLQATIALADAGKPEAASQTATTAVDEINKAIQLNPVHLNFYRTQSLIFLTLAQYEPSFYDAALQTLAIAQKLAPTEPKLVYDMGVIYDTTEATAEAEQSYEKAVDLKPNFDTARFALGKLFERENQKDKAMEQYKYILDNINSNNKDVQDRYDFLATQEAKKK